MDTDLMMIVKKMERGKDGTNSYLDREMERIRRVFRILTRFCPPGWF